MSDYIHFILGEYSSFAAKLAIQRPKVNIVGSDGKIVERVTSDVPDHISIIGELVSGASLSIHLRRGQAFQGSPGFLWNIHGELGEIRVTASSPAFTSLDAAINIEVHDFDKDDVEEVGWEWNDTSLPVTARNVGGLYEQFSLGAKGHYPDFDEAVKRHQYIEALFKSSEEGKSVAYHHE